MIASSRFITISAADDAVRRRPDGARVFVPLELRSVSIAVLFASPIGVSVTDPVDDGSLQATFTITSSLPRRGVIGEGRGLGEVVGREPGEVGSLPIPLIISKVE